METVVVITGASGGIGEAAALALAGRGARVALVARGAEALAAVARRCGQNALPIIADATVRDDVRRVVREALGRFGGIDVWINNVGRGITRAPSQLSDQDIDEMMRVNVLSALYGMQEVLPHFKERGTGHLINISSMLGRIAYKPVRSAYSGAKHFLNALTADLRAELAEECPGIQVSLVSPGVVRTGFGLHALHGGTDSRTISDSQSAEEVGEVIADLVESRRPDVYTRRGARARVIGYFSALGEDA